MIEMYVDARELRRLLSSLAAVLCGLFIAGLFASIVVPGLRNANKPETPTAVSPVIGETGWLNPTEFPPERGRVIPPVDPKTLMEPSAELTAQGKALFEKDCVQCHGQTGEGNGPAAATMNPRPRNFTSPDGWTNGYNMPAIYRTLSKGVNNTSMASFDYLSRKDRMALVHYVQSLGSFSHKTGSPEALEALSKELATAGEKTPNKIPVSMAMARLEAEFTAPSPLVVGRQDQSPGGEIIRRVLINPSRAALVLRESKLWRANARDLATSILPDTPANGFSVSTADLSISEWQALYAELLKRIKPE
jgi:mono/diheme cytochrome c family protein